MKTLLIVTFTCLLITGAVVGSPIVDNGWDPDAVSKLETRYRSFGNTSGEEVFAGVPDLGQGSNRSAIDFHGTDWGTSNDITVNYDGYWLTTTVNTGSSIFNTQYATTSPEDLNNLQLSVIGRDAGTSVDFNDVTLNGFDLGDFSGDGWKDYNVKNIELTDGFSLNGTLELNGNFGSSQELSKLNLKIGTVAIPEPLTAALFATGGVLLLYRRRKKIKLPR